MARSVLAAQPFSALSGARFATFDEGVAVLEIDVADDLRQQFGLLHGGVLAYAADNALTFAAGSVHGPSVVTSGLTISYLQGVREGTLRAAATVAHHNSRMATCTVKLDAVADGTATRVAVAQGSAIVTTGSA